MFVSSVATSSPLAGLQRKVIQQPAIIPATSQLLLHDSDRLPTFRMSSSLPCLPRGWRQGWGQGYGRFLWVPGALLASAADGPSVPWWVPTVHCWCVSERCGGWVSAGLLELGRVPGGCCPRPLLPVTHPGCCTLETLCFHPSSICPGFLCDLCRRVMHPQPAPKGRL